MPTLPRDNRVGQSRCPLNELYAKTNKDKGKVGQRLVMSKDGQGQLMGKDGQGQVMGKDGQGQ